MYSSIDSAASMAKNQVQQTLHGYRDQVVDLAHAIHAHPQLAFAETDAATRIVAFLAEAGFAVRTGVYSIPTAFIATVGSGPLHLAFCAEYDALPATVLSDRSKHMEFSMVQPHAARQDAFCLHACGHNLIAGAAVAAAIGLRDIVDAAKITVSVFGTPGEELLGLPEPPVGFLAAGKIALLEAGAFAGVHAAFMLHPAPTPWGFFMPTQVHVRQRARFSCALADKQSLSGTQIRLLEEAIQRALHARHQVPLRCYVAQSAGPEPASTQVELLWIAPSLAEGMQARDAVRHCFEQAASTTGLAVAVTDYAPYPELRNDPLLRAAYRRHAQVLGRRRGQEAHIQEEIRAIFADPRVPLGMRLLKRFLPGLVSPPDLFLEKLPVNIQAGTDFASVSQVIPAIHPFIGIGGMAFNHSAAFAAQADTDEAYRAMLDGALALAWTAVDAATDPSLHAYLLGSVSSRGGSRPHPR